MKTRTFLFQVSTVFPPLLAMFIGLTLFLRSKQEGELSRRMRITEDIVDRSTALNEATQDYLRNMDDRARQRWEAAYADLGRSAMPVFDPVMQEKVPVTHSIRASYEDLAEIFADLQKLRVSKEGDRIAISDVCGKLRARTQTLTSGTFQMLHAGQMQSVAREQLADAVLILLTSILAIVMSVAAYLGVHEEVSERRKVGEALRQSDIRLSEAFLKLRRATEQIIQTERLRVLESISRGIVHECRNSLMPVISGADFLISADTATLTSDDGRQCLTTVKAAAKRASDSIDRLASFIRTDIDEKEEILNVNDAVRDALRATEARWKNRASWQLITVKTEFQNVQPVSCRKSDLVDAVSNVIFNAVEALPKGGTITFRTQALGTWVGIEVHDTGVGMTEDVRQRCFDPFFSTKGPEHAGMGLALVHGIIRQYHGSIDIEGKAGTGTTVVICMPVEAPQTKAKEDSSYRELGKLNILVVDDEPWARTALLNDLTVEGHVVETAPNGKEGLEKFRRGKFDLVISDRAMPDMTGMELAAAVKQIAPGKPVILITGFADGTGFDKKASIGVDSVISKPIRMDELRKAMATVLLRGK